MTPSAEHDLWRDALAETAGDLTLDRLGPGDTATVRGLITTGDERRRLMDLGFIPGVQVSLEMGNPLGDPRAYRVMGAVVALRREQARGISIAPDTEVTDP
jgi:ferrous iron transport protein A